MKVVVKDVWEKAEKADYILIFILMFWLKLSQKQSRTAAAFGVFFTTKSWLDTPMKGYHTEDFEKVKKEWAVVVE